jgi:VanZ family protein
VSIETMSEAKESERAATGPRERLLSLWASPRAYPVGPAIAWTFLLLGLCLTPRSMMPDEDDLSFRRFFPHLDLVVHFTLFAGFAMSWLRVRGWRPRWLAAPVIGLFLAGATEYAQGLSYIHRDPSLLDALADVVGLLAGLTAAFFLDRAAATTARAGEPG